MQWMTEETGWLLPEDDDVFAAAYRSPEKLPALGAGLARAANRVIVGCADSDAAKTAAALLCGGITAAGGSVCFAPDCIPAALQTGAALHHCGILVHCGAQRIQMFARGLLPLTVTQLRQIHGGMQSPNWMHRNDYGELRTDRGLSGIYTAQLRRRLPMPLPVRADIRSASPLLTAVMQRVFSGGHGKEIILRLSADGRRASVYTEHSGWIFYEKLLLMCCQKRLAAGEDTALPNWLPHIAEEMGAHSGSRVLRYAAQPDGRDTEARQLAALQGFTLDGAVLCAEILRICAETGISLREWADTLPPCFTVRRILRTDTAADAALRISAAMHTRQEADGLRIRTAAGEALLHPAENGRAIAMLVEARSMEAAAELAGDLSAMLTTKKQTFFD